MKTATLGQGKKILELLENVPVEHLQKLIKGGYVSDLFKANVDEMNRDEFRKVCGLSPILLAAHHHGSLTRYRRGLDIAFGR